MYSKEHLIFLKKLKREKIIIHFLQILIVIIFIILWQLLADTKIINSFITSSPKKVLETLYSLHINRNLYHHIFVTVYETLISFSLGTILGFIIASILWWNKTIYRIIDPFLTILNSLPKIALGPIIIIWGGAGIKSIIIMALLISTIITIINVTDGFNSTPPIQLKLMKSLNASKFQTFFKLIIPNSIRYIVSALKINISMSLIGLLPPVGEKIFLINVIVDIDFIIIYYNFVY